MPRLESVGGGGEKETTKRFGSRPCFARDRVVCGTRKMEGEVECLRG